MGLLISRVWDSFFGLGEVRMLMIGLDAAGKTTILYKVGKARCACHAGVGAARRGGSGGCSLGALWKQTHVLLLVVQWWGLSVGTAVLVPGCPVTA